MSNPLLDSHQHDQEESHWLSISDLMAGLMMVFLFIAVALMRDAFVERDTIKQIAVTYQQNQMAIFDALNREFSRDLTAWNAVIDPESLTFTFQSQDVFFGLGKIELNDKYKRLLDDFFPRYLNVLNQFSDSISEVRIEGHTSSGWSSSTTPAEAYFLNMALSQGRTRSVLEHIYNMPSLAPHRAWIKDRFSAVGLSSSHPLKLADGAEDAERSRRVTFRVISNSENQIKQILQQHP